jgi:N-acetylneuraminic acid mutarotase
VPCLKYKTLLVIALITMLRYAAVPVLASPFVSAEITVRPEARGAHSMVFDPYNNVTMIFGGTSLTGGYHNFADTWVYSYSENAWTKLMLTPSPPARSNHATVYCSATNEIILFGGMTSDDTWSYDCETQTWSEVMTSTSPGIHHSLGLAYDSDENVVILFGGFGEDGLERNDTWKFDCATREWAELFPSTAPLARYGHVMVYDKSIKEIVLTSGNTATQGHQQDTWVFNTSVTTWTRLTPIGTPDRLKWPSMTYDSVNQKCILFGGQIGDYAVNRTWIYDAQLNTWTRRYPALAPDVRINTGLAFDSLNNVAVLYGGIVIDGPQYDDTWTYSYESNVWTIMGGGTGAATDFSGVLLGTLILVAAVAMAMMVIVLFVRRRA